MIEVIRCADLALGCGIAGVRRGASEAFMKHPPRQPTDDVAHRELEAFIAGSPALLAPSTRAVRCNTLD